MYILCIQYVYNVYIICICIFICKMMCIISYTYQLSNQSSWWISRSFIDMGLNWGHSHLQLFATTRWYPECDFPNWLHLELGLNIVSIYLTITYFRCFKFSIPFISPFLLLQSLRTIPKIPWLPHENLPVIRPSRVVGLSKQGGLLCVFQGIFQFLAQGPVDQSIVQWGSMMTITFLVGNGYHQL